MLINLTQNIEIILELEKHICSKDKLVKLLTLLKEACESLPENLIVVARNILKK